MSARGVFVHPQGEGFETEVGLAINRLWLAAEADVLGELLPLARLPAAGAAAVRERAMALVSAVRASRDRKSTRLNSSHRL